MCGLSVVEDWEGFGGGRRISGHSVVDDGVGLVTEKDVLSLVVILGYLVVLLILS